MDNTTSFPALDLADEDYNRTEEVTIDEWIDRFNELVSKHGGVITKRKGNIITVVHVEKIDEVRDVTEQICVTSYDDENFMTEDVREYINTHDITLIKGCFHMKRKRRVRGYKFTLDDGSVLEELLRDEFTRWYKMLIFPNNPNRLAWRVKEIIIPNTWSKDFAAVKSNEVFCMKRFRNLSPEDVKESKRRGVCDACNCYDKKKCERFFV